MKKVEAMALKEKKDPYLRYVKDMPRRPGLTAIDVAGMIPFTKSLIRLFESRYHGKNEKLFFPKNPDHILLRGAAVGLDQAGICRHFQPGDRFAGFLESQDMQRACVRTRDSIILRIPGTKDPDDRGKPVYCSGPNEFSLQPQEGSAEIGRVRYVQNETVAVAFKKWNDEKPLDMVVVPDPLSVPA